MFEGLIELIKQRMAQLGYTKFHYEPIRVQSAAGTSAITVSAQNEFYYLTAKSVPASFLIESDTAIFTAADAAGYANFNFYNFKEFSGNIKITQAIGAVDAEFIRVIPEY